MREGWKYVSSEKSINKVKKQKSVKSKDYKEKGIYPIVSQESALISGYCDDESLLFRHSNPIVIFGDHTKNIKYIDFDFVVGADGVHILSPIEIIFPKFFYYQLCSIKLRNLGYARHYKLLKQSFIAIPPLYEQERIVSLLDLEFAKIDAIKANAEKQLQDAKDLFQSALKDLLTSKEGWKEGCLGDFILNLRTGLNPRQHFKLNTEDAEGYYITVRELKGFDIVVDNKTDRVNKEALLRINRRSELKIDDVLFSGTGTIGNTALISELPQDWNIKEGIYAITPKHNLINSRFLIYLLGSDFFLKEARKKAEGTGVMSVPMKRFVNLLVGVPSLEKQALIVEKLDVLSERFKLLQSNYEQTITLCNDLKQSILKDIFG